MKKLIFLPLIFSALLLNAQQWAGSTTTSDLIYRDGRVLVGGSSLIGSWGTNNQSGLIQIQSPLNTYGWLSFRHVDNATSFDIGFNSSCCAQLTAGNVPLVIRTQGSTSPITFSTNNTERLKINADGTIGIGTSNTGSFKLAVEGKIGARELKVTLDSPWPDYVFETGYDLINITNLEKYIAKNKHLPGIPSASDIQKNNGFEVGDMATKLLGKIEELSLYIIQLKKENEEIKKQLKVIQNKTE
jgi:hypothetical protein